MPFFELNGEQKQHLNLSLHAVAIIENDMLAFQIPARSTILNRIIRNYRYDAEATVTLSSQRYQASLIDRISVSKNAFSPDECGKIINLLVEDYINGILARNASYTRYHGFKIRIDKETMEYFTQECKEDAYYPNMGSYIKAIVEEYCQKSYLEREQIILKETFSAIYSAIDTDRVLSIQFLLEDYTRIRPYKIVTDSLNMYHYLIGYTVSHTPKTQLQSFSCRVSHLKKVKVLEEHSFISSGNKKILDQELIQKGAQFMSGAITTVRIALSDQGILKYKRLLHLRPNYVSISDDGHVYTFNCSLNQIEFYFFKFGEDAVILTPIELRQKFQNMYKRAYECYDSFRESL